MHKKNRWSIARTSWLILVVLAVVFVWMLLKFPITPFVWRAAVCAVLAVIVVLLGWLSFRRKRRLHRAERLSQEVRLHKQPQAPRL